MKKHLVGGFILVLLLAGCATGNTGYSVTPTYNRSQSTNEQIEFIKNTWLNIKSAPCPKIDRAMGMTYMLNRMSKDPTLVKMNDKNLKTARFIFATFYRNFKSEFRKRCPGKPLGTLAVKKMYPQIIAEAKARAKAQQARR